MDAGSHLGRARTTLIVVPRERFSVAEESLESIVADTPRELYELVYVAAGAPSRTRDRLAARCAELGFRFIAHDQMLSPNEARNRGLAEAATEYVVFIDNDVVVQPGWLAALVACADETGAWVVAPLTCHGNPPHTTVHHAGGRFTRDVKAFFATPPGCRLIEEEMLLQGTKRAEVAANLARGPTQFCEFHCVLARRDAFAKIGPLDEELLATKEHVDLCMSVLQAGGAVFFEPESVVTYYFPDRNRPIRPSDWPFFLLRWSEEWQLRSLHRLEAKWGLKPGSYVEERRSRFGWRYYEGVLKPLARSVPLVGGRYGWQRRVGIVGQSALREVGRALVASHQRRRRPAPQA